MTLDEAIKHAEEVAEGHEKIKCIKAVTLEECKCAEEHRQLAEWLKDYKRLKEAEMPCVSAEEMQKCKDIVKKYTPKQQPCDEVVSRQAVNTLVDELARAISDERCFIPQRGRSTATIMQEILDLPPVTLRPKSGKWIIKEDNTSFVKTIPRRWAECSCCKWSMSPGYVDRYAFCPNCGAKMVEPQERSEG